MNRDDVILELRKICLANHFIRRGNTWFRIQGDGVLQVVQVKKDHNCSVQEISLGLFSMYGDLRPEWFTAPGCIPRYLVVEFIGLRSADYWEMVDHEPEDVPFIRDSRGVYVEKNVTMAQQLEIFQSKALPFLNAITTQGQLAEAICRLDEMKCSQILWNDTLKYEPFLHSGDYQTAQKVMQAILDQHSFAFESRRRYMSPQEFQEYYEEQQKEDVAFWDKLKLAQDSAESEIQAYLNENFARNMEVFNTTFHKKGNKKTSAAKA